VRREGGGGEEEKEWKRDTKNLFFQDLRVIRTNLEFLCPVSQL
jgi:hypothetical protein